MIRSIALLFALAATADAARLPVYVLAGQSNASGFADANAIPEDVLRDASKILYRPTQGMLTTVAPVRGTFGPEIALAAGLSRRGSAAIVKYAIGSTDLAEDWAPSTGIRYANLRSRVNSTLGALIAHGDQPYLAGVFWIQGEEDALHADFAAAYAANLDALLAAFARDFPKAPIAIARINAPYRPYRDLVREAQEDADVAAIWNTDDLPLMDRVHLDAAGQLELGDRFAASALSWRFQILPTTRPASVPEPSTRTLGFVLIASVLSIFAGMMIRARGD